MALIDKASLLMVPSTYEAGKLYNVLPSGNRAPDSTDQNSGYDQTRADFDFDRGSNASATRIGSDGLIKKYRENKLLQSNAFSTSPWNTNLVTATSGQSGYDGNTNAWKIDLTGATGNLAVGGLSVGNVGTYSVYAKAGTLNWIVLGSQSGNIQAYINLSDGSIGTTGALVIEAKTEDVGGGWYRCSMTYSGTATVARVYPAQANGDLTATSGNILIQNAQLESGLVASSYLESTSVTGKAGVLVDLPRINYDANGENGALLLEPSRQNNILYSENVTNSWWLKSNVTALDNQGISPEGLNNAGEITLTSTGGAVLYRTSLIIGDGVLSFFAKPGTLSGGRIRVSVDGIGAAYWNLDGTISSVSGGTAEAAENYGNGWFRYSYNVPSGSVANYGVQGGIIGESMLVYGMQVEPNASYPSSYIPTMGTSETRAADSCSVTGASDVIGQTEGTLFAELNARTLGENRRILFSYEDGSNFIMLTMTNTDRLRFLVFAGAAIQADFSTPISVGNVKIAGAYKANDFVFYVNGTQIGTDTSGSVPTTSDIYLGVDLASALPLADGIKQALLFKTRLTNAELADLTTI